MSEFTGVTVVKKANVFFGGGVTSRTLLFSDGSKKTLGIMQPGEYEFTTKDAEIMEIIAGELDVLLPALLRQCMPHRQILIMPAHAGHLRHEPWRLRKPRQEHPERRQRSHRQTVPDL